MTAPRAPRRQGGGDRIAPVPAQPYLLPMPPRLRPTRLEYVVDGVRLRAQLSAAALDAIGDEAEQRRRALEILKARPVPRPDDRQGAAGERRRRASRPRGCSPASPTR